MMIDLKFETINGQPALCATWLVDGIELRRAVRACRGTDIGVLFKELEEWFASEKWKPTIERMKVA